MNKFKVGDIVVGKKDNVYLYTGEGSINEVISILGRAGMCVKLIKVSPHRKGEGFAHLVGNIYIVDTSGFELENPNLENV